MKGWCAPGMETKTHYVYECYAQDGTCLYVGCSAQVGTRLQSHVTKPWWPEVTHVQLSRYEGYDAGHDAELERILSLNPVHNILTTHMPTAAHRNRVTGTTVTAES